MREESFLRFKSTRYFSNLDGLRAFAILWVIWYHHSFASSGFLPHGWLGVQLFFALSGFLITTLLLREFEQNSKINLFGFWWRRSIRIFPLYFTVLGVYTGLVWITIRQEPSGQSFFNNLPFFLTYTSNWFVGAKGEEIFSFSWSLAAEEQFYLIWPVMLFVFGRWKAAFILGGLVLFLLYIRNFEVHWLDFKNQFHWKVIYSIQLTICYGVLFAFALHYKRTHVFLSEILQRQWVGLMLIITFFALLSFREIPIHALEFLLALIVVHFVVNEKGTISRFLQFGPVVLIGQISYGMYLMHGLGKNFIGLTLPESMTSNNFIYFTASSIVTFIAALLSFRFFENPIRKKGRTYIAEKFSLGNAS